MEMQQKDLAQTKLMTGNLQVWQGLLNITQPNIWLKLWSALIKCNDTLCQGNVILYNATDIDILCKFLALPLAIEDYYWVPDIIKKSEKFKEHLNLLNTSIVWDTPSQLQKR